MSDHHHLGLITRLVEHDPWERSREGLDDCCHFCGAVEFEHHGDGWTYLHRPGCPWIEGRELIDRPTTIGSTRHVTGIPVGDHGRLDFPKLAP